MHQAVLAGNETLSVGEFHRVRASVERSVDALTDACMVTETGVWVLTQRRLVQVSAYLVLLRTHQAASTGVEMGSRGSHRRGPSSLGEPGGGDLGGL